MDPQMHVTGMIFDGGVGMGGEIIKEMIDALFEI